MTLSIQGSGAAVITPVRGTGAERNKVKGFSLRVQQPTMQIEGPIQFQIQAYQFFSDSEGNDVSGYGENFTTDSDGNIIGDGPAQYKDVVQIRVGLTDTLTFRKQ